MADDLERFLHDEPLALPRAGLGHRLRRWGRRAPGLASRVVGLGIVAFIEQIYYWTNAPTPQIHWAVMLVLLTWGLFSWGCQWLLHRTGSGEEADRGAATVIPYVWAGGDAVLFTLAVMLAAEPRELLIVGYPLLIVAAGFWLRVQLVAFMTAICLGSYLVLYATTSDLEWPPHYPFLIGGILLLVGTFVGYQVQRLRALSRYFDRHTTGI